MEWIRQILDFVLHLDRYLEALIDIFGLWSYAVLFLVIFMETGFVVTPFLPGDSLIFAAGAFTAKGSFHLGWLLLILSTAAVLGDTANYWIGHFIGPKVFSQEKHRFFKKEYLDKTHKFYEKYGNETIIIARFVPIVRTFAPFVAGIGKMSYGRFLLYNVVGGIGWVFFFTLGGYFFGNLPFVKSHFTVVLIAIILISLLPAVYEFWKHWKEKREGETVL